MKKTMFKERYVTRTILTVYCTVLCYDMDKNERIDKHLSIPADADNATLLEFARYQLENDVLKVLGVTNVQKVENLYKLSEADFIRYGKVVEK